jgi:symplekin
MSESQPEPINAATSPPLDVEDEDDDYEPDFYGAEDNEQILNKLDGARPDPEESKLQAAAPDMALGHFRLPAPLPLTQEQVAQAGQENAARLFAMLQTFDEKDKRSKTPGFNRMAASAHDRSGWITIIIRIATRGLSGLEDSDAVMLEPSMTQLFSFANTVRESLYAYIFDDFRKRIDIAVQWLCEEWYNDQIRMKMGGEYVLHYEKWALRVLDGIVPYLDGTDRTLLIKFLGEIPGLTTQILERIKGLCVNPSTVTMALQSMYYMVAYRAPARQLVLGAVEEIWDTCKILPLIIEIH